MNLIDLPIELINNLSKIICYKDLLIVYMSNKIFYKNTNKYNEIKLKNIYFTPKDYKELKHYVEFWYTYKDYKSNFKCHISRWNTMYINNMERLFLFQKDFNDNINNWIVTNVTSMELMFYGCNKYNQPLDKWNIKNVENTDFMFTNCFNFNQNINMWNTSKIKTMKCMFHNNYNYNQPLNNWNIKNVNNTSYMFCNARKFNQKIDKWNNIEDVSSMFKYCIDLKLDNWNRKEAFI